MVSKSQYQYGLKVNNPKHKNQAFLENLNYKLLVISSPEEQNKFINTNSL